jgi:hypothetical protein
MAMAAPLLCAVQVVHRVLWSGEVQTRLLLRCGAGGAAVSHELGQSLSLPDQLYAAWEINSHLDGLFPVDGIEAV